VSTTTTILRDPQQMPRVFQANLYRFFVRVVQPTLAQFAPGVLEYGAFDDLDRFLSAASAQVENHTANEAAKAFTLITSGLFERQLRIWGLAMFGEDRQPDVRTQAFGALLADCVAHVDVDPGQLGVQGDLEEAQLVANVVRHGDGRASAALEARAPRLWIYEETAYIDLLPSPSPASERMLVRPEDVVRYVRAGLRFWGLVDPLDGAIVEPPI
jgi:hypothetical protein